PGALPPAAVGSVGEVLTPGAPPIGLEATNGAAPVAPGRTAAAKTSPPGKRCAAASAPLKTASVDAWSIDLKGVAGLGVTREAAGATLTVEWGPSWLIRVVMVWANSLCSVRRVAWSVARRGSLFEKCRQRPTILPAS